MGQKIIPIQPMIVIYFLEFRLGWTYCVSMQGRLDALL